MSQPDPHLTILLYHGVTDVESEGIENFSRKHIHRDEFAAQIRRVRRHHTPLSVEEVVEIHRNGEPYPENAVLVSFDDGFENNYSLAAPVLADEEVPAVFYLSTGLVGTSRMFWVDQIEDTINRSGIDSIAVRLGSGMETFPLCSSDERIEAVQRIKGYCKASPAVEKDAVIRDLVAATGVSPDPEASRNYRTMSWDQAREMDGERLFTLGGHTVNHNILTRLTHAEMRLEVRDCMAALERELGARSRHFSYPEGQADHYDEAVIDELKSAGVVCSPSAIDGVATRDMGLFHLRRIMVGFMGTPSPV